MHIYAIGDLHLSFSQEKPMDVFGESWRGHTERIERAWRDTVGAEDLVIIPGDISWAMQLSAALPDLSFIGRLPGTKLLLRGNHDYWWSSVTQVRASLAPGMYALQNDAFPFGDACICGTRGWACPGSAAFDSQDQKIYERELQRLSLSLGKAEPGKTLVVMTHYPPFSEKNRSSGFTELLEQAGCTLAVYGHLHGAAHKSAFEGEQNGVAYRCVAADYLQFTPKLLL